MKNALNLIDEAKKNSDFSEILGLNIESKIAQLSHRIYRGMLPLRNAPDKRILFFNTMVCSSKELGTRISRNAWPFP